MDSITSHLRRQLEALRARGKSAFTDGNYRAAQSVYTEAIEAIDGRPDAQRFVDLWAPFYLNRALVRLKLHDGVGALQDTEAALSLDGASAKAFFLRAKALAAVGRPLEALTSARNALRLHSGNADTQRLIADLQEGRQGRRAPSDSNPASEAPEANLENRRRSGYAAASPPSRPLGPSPGLPPRATPPQPRPGFHAAPCLAIARQSLPESGHPSQCHRFLPCRPGHIPTNLLVLLHGLGDTPESMERLAQGWALPNAAALALAAPIADPNLPGGLWLEHFTPDYEERPPRDPVRTQSLGRSADALCRLVLDLERESGCGPGRIHLFGFRQGGTAALHAALLHQTRRHLRMCSSTCDVDMWNGTTFGAALGSVVAVRAGLELPDDLKIPSGGPDPPLGPEILILRVADDVSDCHAPPALEARVFEALGCPRVGTEVFPGPHPNRVTRAQNDALMRFWSRNLKAPMPPDVLEDPEILPGISAQDHMHTPFASAAATATTTAAAKNGTASTGPDSGSVYGRASSTNGDNGPAESEAEAEAEAGAQSAWRELSLRDVERMEPGLGERLRSARR